jgi:putative ABC transport system substrate-binding protein
MRRREFITLVGGAAAAWPPGARAQQRSTPVVGFLSSLSQAFTGHLIEAARRGLSEAGFTEGQNIEIEYRFADGEYDRLPKLASELVRRPVSIIIAAAPPAAFAAKTLTTTIPIVFVVGVDPVASGLVASLNRPGANATGMSLITGPLGQKRIEFLRMLLPKASAIAMLANPASPDAVPEIRDVQAVAQANNIAISMFNAGTLGETETAFAEIASAKPAALLVGSDPFFTQQAKHIAGLAAHYRLPTIYPFREFAAAGGLMSYGTSLSSAYRQAGLYAARILKGTKPADLPVMLPTTFELVINRMAAEALGLNIPDTLLAIANEVFE